MKRIITSIVLLTALISCKQEKETPKVIYEDGKSKVGTTAKDTASFKVADLPILMEGTQYLIHPVGDIRVYDTDSKAYGSSKTNQVSYAISNYNRFEITGFLKNIYIQHIDSVNSKPLTDKPLVIQTATYLNTFAQKSKKQIMVYSISDMDTNKDGKLDSNDIRSLYISDISGDKFTKITPDYQELIDWNLMEVKNRLYIRTIQDSNKNGDFDKDDAVFYYFIDLMDAEWKLNEYKPFN